MKIANTTKLSPTFIRRLVSWVRAEIGLPASELREVKFGNRARGFSGRAWLSEARILVRLGRKAYPFDWTHRGIELIVPDELAGVVYVTAHEIQHLMNCYDGSHYELVRDRDMEPHCVRKGKQVIALEARLREAGLWPPAERLYHDAAPALPG